MKIDLKRFPRCEGASDEWCIWDLYVNGHKLGSFYGGKDLKYKDPDRWAKEQIKKRVPVIKRNIERLELELLALKTELDDINPPLSK